MESSTLETLNGSSLKNLLEVITRLRGKNGCPWDKKQTPKSIATYLIEEAFELLNAIESGDENAICEELGDVLFQILFISFLYKEKGGFDIEAAATVCAEKMIRRHPHVFGEEQIGSVDGVLKRWEEIKKEEKKDAPNPSIFDSIPKSLPALLRAYRIGSRAASLGFDWNNINEVWEKAGEEWAEFETEAIKIPEKSQSQDKKSLEFGDILFTLANVARFAQIHPETALTGAIEKFEKRFQYMEKKALEQGSSFATLNRDAKEALWNEAKTDDGLK